MIRRRLIAVHVFARDAGAALFCLSTQINLPRVQNGTYAYLEWCTPQLNECVSCLDLDLDNSRQEPEAMSATSGCALRKSGEPTLEGRYCAGLSN